MRKITRRISMIAFALSGLLLLATCSAGALAQAPQSGSPPAEPDAGVDDNPTRAVFFSIREEYRDLVSGGWNNRVVFRRDAVVLKGGPIGGRTGFLLRADVPITTTHLGAGTHTGLGDIYAQVLYIPYLSRKFGFVTGSGIVFPTATHRTLGLAKWQVAPLAVPVWFLPEGKGYVMVKFQEFISFAGVGDRPGIHLLFINPTINYMPAKRWLLQADVESRTNWKNEGRTDYRVGFGAGRVLTRKMFLGVKCEVPIGPTRSGDVTMKVVTIFYR